MCFAIFSIDKNIEERICLKFYIANGISYAESLEKLQKDYGESTLSKIRAYEWYSAFKSGRDVLEDLPRSARPSTSSTEVNGYLSYEVFERANSTKEGRFADRKFINFSPR